MRKKRDPDVFFLEFKASRNITNCESTISDRTRKKENITSKFFNMPKEVENQQEESPTNQSNGRENAKRKRSQSAFEKSVYQVKKIQKMAKMDGKKRLLVQWEGYSRSSDTWEPEENILDKSLINNFKKTP